MAAKGSLIKARNLYFRDRGWRKDDQWYREWEQGNLPREVEAAVKQLKAK